MAQMLTQVYYIYYIFTGILWVSQKHIKQKTRFQMLTQYLKKSMQRPGFPPHPSLDCSGVGLRVLGLTGLSV